MHIAHKMPTKWLKLSAHRSYSAKTILESHLDKTDLQACITGTKNPKNICTKCREDAISVRNAMPKIIRTLQNKLQIKNRRPLPNAALICVKKYIFCFYSRNDRLVNDVALYFYSHF